MHAQYKFHAIAIAAITAIVSVAYMLMDAPPTQSTNTPAYAIEVTRATWGANCAQTITDAIEARTHIPATTEESAALEPLTPVTPDNVLPAVTAACNGKAACELQASKDALGIDPMHSCFKRLVVSYRCFSFDRLTTLDIGQGELLSIDCAKPPANDAANKTNPK